jgi:hypothetical protein
MGSVFGPIRFLLPVCQLCWFLYTLKIYVNFASHFSKQLLITGIWYLVKLNKIAKLLSSESRLYVCIKLLMTFMCIISVNYWCRMVVGFTFPIKKCFYMFYFYKFRWCIAIEHNFIPKWGGVIVFNVTFNNNLVISWRSGYWWRKPTAMIWHLICCLVQYCEIFI